MGVDTDQIQRVGFPNRIKHGFGVFMPDAGTTHARVNFEVNFDGLFSSRSRGGKATYFIEARNGDRHIVT